MTWDKPAQSRSSIAPLVSSAGGSRRGQGVPDVLTVGHVWGEQGCTGTLAMLADTRGRVPSGLKWGGGGLMPSAPGP